MSQVYASEPPTTGRVIFDTSHGPLEVSLWCTEAPQTTRWFLQCCLDGFYDNVLFHRILPNTLLQCGALRLPDNATTPLDAVDLTTAGRAAWEDYRRTTQAAAALERQPYELHSRLRFRHRGLVAMALPSSHQDANNMSDDEKCLQQTQFFVTLEEASYLDGQHVVFGTVSGPTIFNALRMGRIVVDEKTGQPLDWAEAPRIRSVKIVENTVHTALVKQPTLPWRLVSADKSGDSTAKKKKKKRKGKFDTNVLSFGDEMEDAALPIRPNKHNKTLRRDEHVRDEERNASTTDAKVDPGKPAAETSTKENSSTVSVSSPSLSMAERDEKDHETAQRIEKPSLAPTAAASLPVSLDRPRAPKQSAMEARRAKYAKKGIRKSSSSKKSTARQEDIMAKLAAFQGRVKESVGRRGGADGDVQPQGGTATDNSWAARMARRAVGNEPSSVAAVSEAPTYHGQVLEDNEGASSNWMATTFKCKQHMDHTAGSDGRKVDDYKVVDDRPPSANDGHHHHRKHGKKSKHRHRE